jgi:hypothetical protein
MRSLAAPFHDCPGVDAKRNRRSVRTLRINTGFRQALSCSVSMARCLFTGSHLARLQYLRMRGRNAGVATLRFIAVYSYYSGVHSEHTPTPCWSLDGQRCAAASQSRF